MLTTKKLGLVLAAALLAAPFAASAQEAAPAAFNQCKACHVIGKNGVGPNLAGVFGRKAGSFDGFKYSDAMKAAPAWDEATLTKYLTDPKGTIPGNKMVFAGIKKPEDLAAVIAYLKVVK
ncbi:MAG: cytochrome c family protein [Phaeospirillum sp.]|nr:cytochrome c family protein [Phaeospirillum sp.]